MIASSLDSGITFSKNADRQSRAFPRLTVLLVGILALVNVSATVMMARRWARLSTGMLELERSMQDPPTKLVS